MRPEGGWGAGVCAMRRHACSAASLTVALACSLTARPCMGFVAPGGAAGGPCAAGMGRYGTLAGCGPLARLSLRRYPQHGGRHFRLPQRGPRMQLAEDGRLPALRDDVPGPEHYPTGRPWGDVQPGQAPTGLPTVAAIIIAAFTLTACGAPYAAHAEFDPTDRARPTDEVVLDMKNMQEACSNGWAPNWRNTGKASVCLEPDGCLWRKVDISARQPGRKWYEPVYDKSAETYNVPFVNYLTRFIINYDPRWQEWWTLRQQALTSAKDTQQAEQQLQRELQRFAGSVEYGLSKYQGPQGVKRLFAELELNYAADDDPEANRQLALAFALLDPKVQPVAEILNIAPAGSIHDSTSAAKERQMRDIAAETLQRPLAPEVGVRPGMLPKEVKILKDKDDKAVLTLPGFERPSGLEAEAIFGSRHPGGPVKRERALEPAIYAASALAGLFCCSTMHLVTVPVDVIKTRMQVCVCVRARLKA